MLVRPVLCHDVPGHPASCEQRIRDHRSVAAPGDRLGAHDDCGCLRCRRHQVIHGVPKRRRLHIVGIAPEAGVLPSQVRGVLERLAQTTEFPGVTVSKPGLLQTLAKRFRVELRIMAGARDRAHVHQLTDAVGLQQGEKVLDRPGRVSDGPEETGRHQNILADDGADGQVPPVGLIDGE